MRDWKWNHKVKQHIMINGILDLNQYPSAKHEGTKSVDSYKVSIIGNRGVNNISRHLLCPGNSRDHKRLCCLCCKSGPISAAIHTNRAVS